MKEQTLGGKPVGMHPLGLFQLQRAKAQPSVVAATRTFILSLLRNPEVGRWRFASAVPCVVKCPCFYSAFSVCRLHCLGLVLWWQVRLCNFGHQIFLLCSKGGSEEGFLPVLPLSFCICSKAPRSVPFQILCQPWLSCTPLDRITNKGEQNCQDWLIRLAAWTKLGRR